MFNKILSIMIIGIMALTPLVALETDAAESGYDVTDDCGNTVHFDAPAERVVLNGVGAIMTAATAGMLDKVVGVDKYATYDYTKQEILKGHDAKVLGSFFSSNYKTIIVELSNMVERGEFSKTDVILLTSYPGNVEFREMLIEAGFPNVLVWVSNSVDSYDRIIDFVGDINMVLTGERGTSPGQMQEIVDRIEYTASQATESPTALTLWYNSSTGFSILNNGIAPSMLDVCGADNIGRNSEMGDKYGDKNTIISLLDAHPGTVIFLPDSWKTAGKTIDDFKEEFQLGGTDFKIVQMEAVWNNYCPQSADGLLAMSDALYGGTEELPDDEGGDSDLMMWAVIIIAAIVIVVVAIVAFKRTH